MQLGLGFAYDAFIFACYMLMHYHALLFSSLSLLSIVSYCIFCLLYEKPSRCPNVFILEFFSNIHAIDTSIPSLLWHFEEHVSQLLRSSFFRYYMSLGQLIQTILFILVSIPSFERSWLHSMRKPWCGVIFLLSPHMTLLRVQGSLIW